MARSSRYPNHEFGVIRLRELPVDLPVCDSPERIYDYWVANVVTANPPGADRLDTPPSPRRRKP
jgi:hypothetical protein